MKLKKFISNICSFKHPLKPAEPDDVRVSHTPDVQWKQQEQRLELGGAVHACADTERHKADRITERVTFGRTCWWISSWSLRCFYISFSLGWFQLGGENNHQEIIWKILGCFQISFENRFGSWKDYVKLKYYDYIYTIKSMNVILQYFKYIVILRNISESQF